jgi:hypothetical protein
MPQSADLPSPAAVHRGRTLLSFDEDSASNGSNDHWFNSLDKLPSFEDTINSLKETIRSRQDGSDAVQMSKDLQLVRRLSQLPESMCPTYPNSSEAQRYIEQMLKL